MSRLLMINYLKSPWSYVWKSLPCPFPSHQPQNGRVLSQSRRFSTPRAILLDVPVDEETIPGYDPKYRYHPKPGDFLDETYELKAKIGWGTQSTVWLAQVHDRIKDQRRVFATLKILDARDGNDESARHEIDISEHIDGVESEHRGRSIIRTVADSFKIISLHEYHTCLVFEPMREPLWLFRRRFGQNYATAEYLPIFKTYIKILLEGLDFLHSDCKVIHTDLKLDNILVSFEHNAILEQFVDAQAENPMPRKVFDGRTVYLCHNDFGKINGSPALKKIYPRITDFGLAQRGDQPGPLIFPIQPDHCHAPEVLLGTGWSYSADIWNFGVMIWDLLAGEQLFQTISKNKGPYSAVQHLAEMIALLGSIPPSVVRKERNMRHWRWAPAAMNSEGKECNSVADFYGGPFFFETGEFIRQDLIPTDRSFATMLPKCISEEEAVFFMNFMSRMLTWEPEKRATARELNNDPWLDIHRNSTK